MAKFEVYIPASDANGFNVTLKVGADNWMAALKAGMQKLGEQGAVSQNVMVDIQEDNSVHVTDTSSGRVFRIRELSEAEAQKAQVKKPTQQALPPVPPPAPAPTFAARGEAITEVGAGRSQEPVTLPPTPVKQPDTSPGAPAFDSNKTVLNIAPPPPAAVTPRPPPPAPIPAPTTLPFSTGTPAPFKPSTGQIELEEVEENERPGQLAQDFPGYVTHLRSSDMQETRGNEINVSARLNCERTRS